ncbi:hypothetical protein Tsubulata_027842 [Turnera subulata]|uniref:Uncharacterized protein n=1 Tax=Turnera subulata TaxID=218843 RepID=A0A9Q0FXD2_9ROSI|nr:hypothetical protein Tsubulata_027842 [Turnera subulata]
MGWFRSLTVVSAQATAGSASAELLTARASLCVHDQGSRCVSTGGAMLRSGHDSGSVSCLPPDNGCRGLSGGSTWLSSLTGTVDDLLLMVVEVG